MKPLRKIVGYALVAAPFCIVLPFSVPTVGWIASGMIIGSVAVMVGAIFSE